MLMTGDAISAQEANRLGMVNEIHPQNELMAAAHRVAEKIASNSPTGKTHVIRRASRSSVPVGDPRGSSARGRGKCW